MRGAVKPLFVLPFYFLRLLQGRKSLNRSKRTVAPVDEFHQLCDSPYIIKKGICKYICNKPADTRSTTFDKRLFPASSSCPLCSPGTQRNPIKPQKN